MDWYVLFCLKKEINITQTELDEMDVDQVNWYLELINIQHEKEAKEQDKINQQLQNQRKR